MTGLDGGTFTSIGVRYGFSADVPKDFHENGMPAGSDYGDGISLRSSDSETQLDLFGGSGKSAGGVQYKAERSVQFLGGRITYEQAGTNWFVMSRTTAYMGKPLVCYEKTFFGNGSANTFIVTYPASQRALYVPMVVQIERSFSPGNLD